MQLLEDSKSITDYFTMNPPSDPLTKISKSDGYELLLYTFWALYINKRISPFFTKHGHFSLSQGLLFALALRRIGFGGFKLKVLSSNLSLNNLLIFLAFSNHCIRFYLLAFSVFGFSEKRQRFLLYLPLILFQLIKWFLLDLPNKPVSCLLFSVFSQETNKR